MTAEVSWWPWVSNGINGLMSWSRKHQNNEKLWSQEGICALQIVEWVEKKRSLQREVKEQLRSPVPKNDDKSVRGDEDSEAKTWQTLSQECLNKRIEVAWGTSLTMVMRRWWSVWEAWVSKVQRLFGLGNTALKIAWCRGGQLWSYGPSEGWNPQKRGCWVVRSSEDSQTSVQVVKWTFIRV